MLCVILPSEFIWNTITKIPAKSYACFISQIMLLKHYTYSKGIMVKIWPAYKLAGFCYAKQYKHKLHVVLCHGNVLTF